LARHCTEAGLTEAAGLRGKAGQRSLDLSALVEAIEQLTRALAQIAALPATPLLRREQIKHQVVSGARAIGQSRFVPVSSSFGDDDDDAASLKQSALENSVLETERPDAEVRVQLAKDMLNGTGDVSPGDFAIEDIVPGSAGMGVSTRITARHLRQMNWA
jgi:hypothetical protein